MFFTFEILLIISLVYLTSIPLSFFLYKNQSKRESLETSEEEHEDVLWWKNQKEEKKVILGKLNNIEINFLKNLKALVIDLGPPLN